MPNLYAPDSSIRVTVVGQDSSVSNNDQYSRSAAVGATPGNAVLINAGTAGTVNLTLANGGALVVTVGVGTTILPLSVTAFSVGTATGATAVSLFHT